MFQNLIDYLNRYKTIGIFGYGKDGKSFHTFSKQYLPNINIIIIDQKDGNDYLLKLSSADLIIKSPGISLHNLNIKYDDYNFTSTTQLFLQFFSKITIGITGTKGKSTLSTILYNILQNNDTDTYLCGNIGIPAFNIIDKINNSTKVVMELSSHQLEYITISPHISILINLFPEHLDYYESCQDYYQAKYNIFKYQNSNDIAILNFTTIFEELTSNFNSNIIYNVYDNNLKLNHKFNIKQGYIHKTTLQILEQLCTLLHIPYEVYTTTVSQFKTLSHRLEYIGTFDNINFINDSISTIPQTTIEAIKIINTVDTLIIGGYNRGVNYDILIDFLKQKDIGIKEIIMVSQTGKIIYDVLKNTMKNIHYTNNLKDAIKLSKEITNKDGLCLFSPAASSFDEFKNFEHRGEYFKDLTQNL